MADGIRCIHCGWQEAEHRDAGMLGQKEFEEPQKGYGRSLMDCGLNGFEPDDPGLAEKLAEKAGVGLGVVDQSGD